MQAPQNPQVSVIIPTHNRILELTTAIRSVLRQHVQELEIIVLDDASTEPVREAVEQFEDSRIVFHREEVKSNANVLRNIGLRKARGLYTAFLDSDDEWEENHLESKIAFLKTSSAEGVFGSAFIDDGSTIRYAVSREMNPTTHPVNYLLGQGFAQTSSWVFKTKAAQQILFDEALLRHQDYDYFIRFALQFAIQASWEPTTRIHWKAGVPRVASFPSEILFIDRYKVHLERRLLCNYYFERFNSWKKANYAEAVLHYRKKLEENARFITFNQYQQLFKSQSKVMFPWRLIRFTSHIVLSALLNRT